MKNSVKISRAELSTMLKDPKTYKGCSFVGFDMITQVALTGGKKNPMQGRVQKVHTGQLAMLFSNKTRSAYGTMVGKRLTQQNGEPTEYTPKPLPWGVRVPETACIEHKENDYVQLIYCQRAVRMTELVETLGVQLNENDVELINLMNEKVVGYNTPNGNISYLLDGKEIAKEDIEGLKPSTSEGEQGGLNDAMKVIVRSPKLEGVARMTLNGTVYTIA